MGDCQTSGPYFRRLYERCLSKAAQNVRDLGLMNFGKDMTWDGPEAMPNQADGKAITTSAEAGSMI
jgi:hypothetical protein